MKKYSLLSIPFIIFGIYMAKIIGNEIIKLHPKYEQIVIFWFWSIFISALIWIIFIIISQFNTKKVVIND